MSGVKQKTIDLLVKSMLESQVPVQDCVQILCQKVSAGDPVALELIARVLEAARAASGEAQYREAVNKYNALIDELNAGPLRSAHFMGTVHGVGPAPRARVRLQDGQEATPCVPDAELAAQLVLGDRVMLDAGVKAVLARDPLDQDVGETARFQRKIDAQRVEVVLRDHENRVVNVTAALAEQISGEQVRPGDTLLVCPRRSLALHALPPDDGRAHFRFLSREPVPDVLVERDVAAPPPLLREALDHVRRELTTPEMSRKYRLDRSWTRMLVGPSGTGKTLIVLALIRAVYSVMSEITGVSLELLPHRVMRMRPATVLSKWLGDSDKNMEAFFDELERLASEPYIAPDGRAHHLPVICIIEELDGLAPTRGGHDDQFYGRFLVTMLQRLDKNWRGLRDQLVLFLFTSNVPQHIDPAIIRRAGGKITRLGRLDRRSFEAVLHKVLRERPIRPPAAGRAHGQRNGHASPPAPAELAARLVHQLADLLYSSAEPQDDGLVELTFAGSAGKVVKHLRCFLTGAVVEQAVQNAAAWACQEEYDGQDQAGLSPSMILEEIRAQVRGIVDQLTPQNVGLYVDLPDGERVVQLRRLYQPRLSSLSLERVR